MSLPPNKPNTAVGTVVRVSSVKGTNAVEHGVNRIKNEIVEIYRPVPLNPVCGQTGVSGARVLLIVAMESNFVVEQVYFFYKFKNIAQQPLKS